MTEVALTAIVEDWPLKGPLRIAGHRFEGCPVLLATVSKGETCGRGEAAGVFYLNDDPPRMAVQLREIASWIACYPSRTYLRTLLPPGGARNALDCALWELEARQAGCSVWQLAGVPPPTSLLTTFTLCVDEPYRMAAAGNALGKVRALKVKVTGETDVDIDRVRAVRAARPDVWIAVDANQGFSPATIEPLIPVLVECGIALLEQPFKRGCEAEMEGLALPIRTAADESCLDLAELESLPGRFDVVNIKLDKCGGLTEALMMAARARELGLGVMVGNMVGTSLAMAPAFVLGQLCEIVDLDGPTFLVSDRAETVTYRDGDILCASSVWGGTADRAGSVSALPYHPIRNRRNNG